MTVWLIREPLNREEEAEIASRPYVTLPFGDLPDLSQVHNPGELRKLLQFLNPDAPPETIGNNALRIWAQFTGIARDDVVVVPLAHSGNVAIGEVAGRYEYHTGDDGADMHRVAVAWRAQVKLSSFGKLKSAFAGSVAMSEITDPELRIKIRDKLPHGYNRFAGWKWILVIFFLMQLVVMLKRFVQ
jgi:predicted Mrr-cat superfamily restriction endonuclease